MRRPYRGKPKWQVNRYTPPARDSRIEEAWSFLKHHARPDLTASALAAQFRLKPETAESLIGEWRNALP